LLRVAGRAAAAVVAAAAALLLAAPATDFALVALVGHFTQLARRVSSFSAQSSSAIPAKAGQGEMQVSGETTT
jgi:hypothetical protein